MLKIKRVLGYKESNKMRKSHRLMIPLLVVISISAILGAGVFAAKPDHRDHPLLDGETCDCFGEKTDCSDARNHFTPLCCKVCGGWCLAAHISDNNGKGGAMHRYTNPSPRNSEEP